MSRLLWCYLASWGLAMLLAASCILTARPRFSLLERSYWRFLSSPWKLITFAIAAIGLVVIAPYSGDPTWDYVDAAFMSVLAFATAPWSVGTLYRALTRRASVTQGCVAAGLWLFSVSWSYDLYILLRDGSYPVTWLANLVASSTLYMSAGLLWNLDWLPDRGVVLAFREAEWPPVESRASLARVLWYAVPFMLLVVFAIGLFFVRMI